MAKQVFISHSHSDADVANSICRIIENMGISCWIAPRDVRPGYNYGDEIVGGIENCKAMIILVSDHSNNSKHVMKEIELAINQENSIFPILIQNVEPGNRLKYFLAGIQRVDAWKPPLEEHLKKLIKVLQELLEVKRDNGSAKTVYAEDEIKEAPNPAKVEIVTPPIITDQQIDDVKAGREFIPAKKATSEEKAPAQKGRPKAIHPSIVKLVEIETRKCDSTTVDGCIYNTFLNSNVAAIYSSNLSQDCSYENYLWLLDQTLDSGKDEILRSQYLLLALEFGKRHRRVCDYDLIQRDFNDAPYIVQELVITHLSGTPLRELLFKKAKEWILAVRFRSLQGDLLKIIGSVSTKEVITPLIDIVMLQNHNSIEALYFLSNFHEERIYNVANESMYGKSGWIIGAAARVIAKYPEHAEKSMECLKSALYSALNGYGPGTATENILKAMWSLDPDETVDYCALEMRLFMSNKDSDVKSKYLDLIRIFNIDLLLPNSKAKLLELINEILSFSDLNDWIKNQLQKRIEEIEKHLE